MRQEEGKGRGVGERIGWKLSDVNNRAVSRGQDELIGKFKMAAGDVIKIRGQVMEYTYNPTGIKTHVTPSLPHVHIHLLSSVRERHL